jgi:hypothetical protein
MGGLIASAILAASLAVILRRRRWFAVEPFAIVATYAVHWRWLNQVYERIGGHKPFPEFRASVALVSTYWLIYLVSYFLRHDKSTRESQILTASFLLNAAGFLAVLHHQSFHPEWRFWFLLFAGGVYLGVSAWSRTIDRRLSFVLASLLGAALLIAAVPYRAGLPLVQLAALTSFHRPHRMRGTANFCGECCEAENNSGDIVARRERGSLQVATKRRQGADYASPAALPACRYPTRSGTHPACVNARE